MITTGPRWDEQAELNNYALHEINGTVLANSKQLLIRLRNSHSSLSDKSDGGLCIHISAQHLDSDEQAETVLGVKDSKRTPPPQVQFPVCLKKSSRDAREVCRYVELLWRMRESLTSCTKPVSLDLRQTVLTM